MGGTVRQAVGIAFSEEEMRFIEENFEVEQCYRKGLLHMEVGLVFLLLQITAVLGYKFYSPCLTDI